MAMGLFLFETRVLRKVVMDHLGEGIQIEIQMDREEPEIIEVSFQILHRIQNHFTVGQQASQ